MSFKLYIITFYMGFFLNNLSEWNQLFIQLISCYVHVYVAFLWFYLSAIVYLFINIICFRSYLLHVWMFKGYILLTWRYHGMISFMIKIIYESLLSHIPLSRVQSPLYCLVASFLGEGLTSMLVKVILLHNVLIVYIYDTSYYLILVILTLIFYFFL